MSTSKYPRGLPPQYPQIGRRGSNTPISPMAINETQSTPNRSRSLDGLLDSESTSRKSDTSSSSSTSDQSPSESALKTQSCENILNKQDIEIKPNMQTEEKNTRKTNENSLENSLDETRGNDDKRSISTLSLHSNSSDSKRKRNFMDRCVNKVRSLIKK